MLSRFTRPATLALALALGASSAVLAGDPRRLTVSARGQATATADSVEIEFTVVSRAEEAVDAEKRFRDRLSRVEAALKEGEAKGTPKKKPAKPEDDEDAPHAPPKKNVPAPAKPKPAPAPDEDEDAPKPVKKKKKPVEDEDEDEAPAKPAPKKEEAPKAEGNRSEKKDDLASVPVTLSQRQFTIGVKSSKADDSPMAKIMARQMGGGNEKTESPMTVGCKLVATIANVKGLDRSLLARKVAQLIDVAIEAGAEGAEGDAPVVRFLVDHESLRKAAYKDALAKARARGDELAKLAGMQLAEGVSSISESGMLPVAKGDDQGMQEKMMAAIYGLKSKEGGALPTLDVTTEVELLVSFDLK